MKEMSLFIRVGNALYLWLIGLCIGAMVCSGMFAIPVIFKAYAFLPDLGITQYDSGILTAQIFNKLNILLNFTAIIIIIYELLAFKFSSKSSIILLGINTLSVLLIFIFTLYYTPTILEAQEMGAAYTATPEFEGVHVQSRIVFQVLLFTLSVSFLWRVILLPLRLSNQSVKPSNKATRKNSSKNL